MNFNPRAPYGARRAVGFYGSHGVPISIHAPHTGRDHQRWAVRWLLCRISIHAPHTGRDLPLLRQPCRRAFQSTRPIRGATTWISVIVASIFAFQSTRPIRGATGLDGAAVRPSSDFNPRAPYGARQNSQTCGTKYSNFNPRAPYGARRSVFQLQQYCQFQFQSTRPIRGATAVDHARWLGVLISIHAPHTGRDVSDGLAHGLNLISIHAPHTGRDQKRP